MILKKIFSKNSQQKQSPAVEFHCKSCNRDFKARVAANVLMMCPYCLAEIGSISDYGFGPITPCNVHVGCEKVAEIINQNGYKLVSEENAIYHELSSGYKDLACYKEAAGLVHEWLLHSETSSQHYLYSDR